MQDHEKLHTAAGGNGLKKYRSRSRLEQRTANANNHNTVPAAAAQTITTTNPLRPTIRDVNANANRMSVDSRRILPKGRQFEVSHRDVRFFKDANLNDRQILFLKLFLT
jgi:hypothetical protein